MNIAIHDIVADTVSLIGVEPPQMLSPDAPVLELSTLTESDLYLVGIIGGKDVGKSSLVNALVGTKVSEETSSGPGTEIAIAYTHRSAERVLKQMLHRLLPGEFRIVLHDNASIARQVLIDLPDIDSVHERHLAVTRAMLRHLLYPIWVQSIEKYADQQPQKLLAAVAMGNDPSNFIFCLNKCDQLVSRNGHKSAEELRQDYAGRIARVLSIDAPHVKLISATHPDQFDLPQLIATLSKQRNEDDIARSLKLARRRQDQTLLDWLKSQRLDAMLESTERLCEQAEDLLNERVGAPLLERAIPAMSTDSAHRAAIVEPAIAKRLSRWPIIGALNAVLAPVLTFVQRNVSPLGSGGRTSIDSHLGESDRGLARLVQGCFAELRATQPVVAPLYHNRKLWEDAPSDLALVDLSDRLARAIQSQQQTVWQLVAGKRTSWLWPMRWLLTVGALLWFPILQPMLEATLPGLLQGRFDKTLAELAILFVKLMGATHLLMSLGFLALYFLLLWMVLRFGAQRRINSLLDRWGTIVDESSDTSLANQAIAWLDDLLAPIRARRDRLKLLVSQIHEFEQSLKP